MRIALFTDTFPPEVNGVAHAVANTARSLAERGHTVRVFTVSPCSKKELQDRYHPKYDVEIIPSARLPIYLGVRITPPVGLALRKVATFKPDIIHSHTPFSMGWEAVWASRFLKVPLVGTHHTFFNHYLKHIHLDYTWSERLSWKLTVGYYNRCDTVVSPTRSLVEELVAHGLKRPHALVPNAIDTNLFVPPENKQLIKTELKLPEKVVIYMGRLSYEKSIDQAIRAFKQVAEKEKEAVFVIVGDGPEKSALEALARSLGIEHRVRFTGFVYGEELVKYLQAADVFVTASKSENMPLAVLEAMATSLPVVAVKSLGLAEIIEEGKSGFLLPPDDVPAIADRTRDILNDSRLHGALSKHSRELSEACSEDAITKKLLSVYTQAIR